MPEQNQEMKKNIPVRTSDNLNGKFGSEYFAHITFAPSENFPESRLKEECIIKSRDGSVSEFTAEIVTLYRCKLYEITELFTYLAEAKSRDQFIVDFMTKNNVTNEADIAVYIYRRK